MKAYRAFQSGVILAQLFRSAAFAQRSDLDKLRRQYLLSATGSFLTGNLERLLFIGGESAHIQKNGF